jgi:hypothetical protein
LQGIVDSGRFFEVWLMLLQTKDGGDGCASIRAHLAGQFTNVAIELGWYDS